MKRFLSSCVRLRRAVMSFGMASLLGSLAVSAHAEMIVNVQFYSRADGNPAAAQQNTQGAAVSLDTTPYWNQFSTAGNYQFSAVGPGQVLYLANNNSGLVASGVTFYQSNTEHNEVSNITALPIFKGCIYGVGSQTTTMEFSGLTAGQLYDVYAYGAGGGGGAVKYTLTHGPSDSVTVQTTTDGVKTSYATPDNYVRFASVLPRSGDKLTIVGSSPAGGYFGINGLQVVAVPEPSTYATALAGLACGGYSLFRRRRAR